MCHSSQPCPLVRCHFWGVCMRDHEGLILISDNRSFPPFMCFVAGSPSLQKTPALGCTGGRGLCNLQHSPGGLCPLVSHSVRRWGKFSSLSSPEGTDLRASRRTSVQISSTRVKIWAWHGLRAHGAQRGSLGSSWFVESPRLEAITWRATEKDP